MSSNSGNGNGASVWVRWAVGLLIPASVGAGLAGGACITRHETAIAEHSVSIAGIDKRQDRFEEEFRGVLDKLDSKLERLDTKIDQIISRARP